MKKRLTIKDVAKEAGGEERIGPHFGVDDIPAHELGEVLGHDHAPAAAHIHCGDIAVFFL